MSNTAVTFHCHLPIAQGIIVSVDPRLHPLHTQTRLLTHDPFANTSIKTVCIFTISNPFRFNISRCLLPIVPSPVFYISTSFSNSTQLGVISIPLFYKSTNSPILCVLLIPRLSHIKLWFLAALACKRRCTSHFCIPPHAAPITLSNVFVCTARAINRSTSRNVNSAVTFSLMSSFTHVPPQRTAVLWKTPLLCSSAPDCNSTFSLYTTHTYLPQYRYTSIVHLYTCTLVRVGISILV